MRPFRGCYLMQNVSVTDLSELLPCGRQQGRSSKPRQVSCEPDITTIRTGISGYAHLQLPAAEAMLPADGSAYRLQRHSPDCGHNPRGRADPALNH